MCFFQFCTFSCSWCPRATQCLIFTACYLWCRDVHTGRHRVQAQHLGLQCCNCHRRTLRSRYGSSCCGLSTCSSSSQTTQLILVPSSSVNNTQACIQDFASDGAPSFLVGHPPVLIPSLWNCGPVVLNQKFFFRFYIAGLQFGFLGIQLLL